MTKVKAGLTDDYPPSEATRRRDAALRAALTMPAKPHVSASKDTKKPKKRLSPVKRES